MTTADDVKGQFMGVAVAGINAAKRGWSGLRPQSAPDGTVWSAFLKRALGADEGQTLVEAIGTLVFENTYRILPYRQGVKKDVPETVLGHAAAAHGTALDVAAMVYDMNKKLDALIAAQAQK